jgi:hypothetical protein
MGAKLVLARPYQYDTYPLSDKNRPLLECRDIAFLAKRRHGLARPSCCIRILDSLNVVGLRVVHGEN